MSSRQAMLPYLDIPGTKFMDGRQKTVRELVSTTGGPTAARKVTWKKVQGPGPTEGTMSWSGWVVWCQSIWEEPRPAVLPVPPITQVDLAFPTGRHTPPWRWVPDEFRNEPGGDYENSNNPWVKLASDLFGGTRWASDWQAIPKPGVAAQSAYNAVRVTLGNYGMKHEHKLATCGWMLSEWFKDFWFKGDTHTTIEKVKVP